MLRHAVCDSYDRCGKFKNSPLLSKNLEVPWCILRKSNLAPLSLSPRCPWTTPWIKAKFSDQTRKKSYRSIQYFFPTARRYSLHATKTYWRKKSTRWKLCTLQTGLRELMSVIFVPRWNTSQKNKRHAGCKSNIDVALHCLNYIGALNYFPFFICFFGCGVFCFVRFTWRIFSPLTDALINGISKTKISSKITEKTAQMKEPMFCDMGASTDFSAMFEVPVHSVQTETKTG